MKELSGYISERLELNKDTKTDEVLFKENYETIKKMFEDAGVYVVGNFRKGFGGDFSSQYMRVSLLDEADCPAIWQNGQYLMFDIDFKMKTVELHSFGHIYLTKADQKKSYMTMCGYKQIFKYKGIPFFRKTKFKSAEDCYNKLKKFYDTTESILKEVTDGYPYKEMKIDIC